MPELTLTNISHKYEGELNWILQDVSFKFCEKKHVLIGPSGIGKSTLLHIAAKILTPTSGKVDQNCMPGFITQNSNLLADFTIKENIEIAAQIKKRKAEMREITKLIGIEDILNKFPNQISGGQKQRAAIALALSWGANFILADEPTGNLDNENARIIRDLFNIINTKLKVGMLISTHDMRWLEIADEKLVLNNGMLTTC